MPDQPTESKLLPRDGTSQSDRRLPALDPGYVSVDERSVEDLLAFAGKYAKGLKFYDDHNQEAGTWDRFFEPWDEEADLAEIVSFMEDPSRFEGRKARHYGRPHFALFLTFLKLLRHAKDQLDTLTRRHLEYYYEDVLRMTRKGSVPDRVNVLFRLAPNVDQARLPAGTQLNAGKDSAGQARVYRTDREVVVNRARIDRISAVRVDRRITGIREAREFHHGTGEEAFMAMLSIALGDPNPGDHIPEFKGEQVDFAFVERAKELLGFTQSGLHMKPFELRSLMRLKRRRDGSDDEWKEINGLLEKAARTKREDPEFLLVLDGSRDFEANLVAAIGPELDLDRLFAGATDIENIDDLYEQRLREVAKTFIEDKLHFHDLDDFVRMMQIKVRIDREWDEINRILERAGRGKRGNPFYQLEPSDPAAFEDNIETALGRLTWPGDWRTEFANLDGYYREIELLERHFFLGAEDISFVFAMAVAHKGPSGENQERPGGWEEVYRILAKAHREKIYAGRRYAFSLLRGDRQTRDCFDDLIRFALGEEADRGESAQPLDDLKEYIPRDEDHSSLAEIRGRLAGPGDVTPQQWGDVYRILELAQRNRERLPEPVARRVEWRNLLAHPDATSAMVTEDPESGDTPRWRTFGQIRPQTGEEAVPAETLGWAISSPLLLLSEGQRTIRLTLGFRPETFDAEKILEVRDQRPLKVEVSGAKGWNEIGIEDYRVAGGQRNDDYLSLIGVAREGATPLAAIQFTLAIGVEADPIAPPADAGIAASWPLLRLMLRQIWDADNRRYITLYAPFEALELVAVHMRVDVGDPAAFKENSEPKPVQGLTSLRARNDDSLLDPSQPFEPFGLRPAVGSRLYLTHPELVAKRLDKLVFDIEWMGVPDDLNGYYEVYEIEAEDFQANVGLVDHRRELSLTGRNPAALFRESKAAQRHWIRILDLPRVIREDDETYAYERSLDLPEHADPLAWDRRLLWELTPNDFRHQAYPGLATWKATEMAAAIANKGPNEDIVAADYQVNPPYTPKIKRLNVGYSASLELLFDGRSETDGVAAGADRILHLHPFGCAEVRSEIEGAGIPFLPRYDNEGELYIGILGLRPPQNLSILFQMAEGSADPDLEPVPVQWGFLSGDRWHSLHEGNILSDSTQGLINSGVIELALDPVRPSGLLPGERYWLRATIARHANSVCDLVAIHPQAVSATLEGRGIAPDHYAQPLPPNSITKLVRPLPEITAVEQPYTSYGGRGEEQADLFHTRVSERLRHKQRALTPWDYERLILERFPQIYKAKCLPADLAAQGGDPGKVEIVVIPDVRNQVPFDPFEPKAPADLLADIEGYLSDKCPPSVRVEVRNAYFVPVQVRVGVRFRQGCDDDYYKGQLIRDLNRYLSPWAYEEGADIAIGGTIYANSILGFLDGREYLDYVASIELFTDEDGRGFRLWKPSKNGAYSVFTRRRAGVLVAARHHYVDLISEGGYEEELFTGIGYMKIELDFVVADEASA